MSKWTFFNHQVRHGFVANCDMGLTTNCYITRYNEIQLRGPGECNRQTKRADYGLSSHENKCESREIILFCVDTYISGKPWKTINVII